MWHQEVGFIEETNNFETFEAKSSTLVNRLLHQGVYVIAVTAVWLHLQATEIQRQLCQATQSLRLFET